VGQARVADSAIYSTFGDDADLTVILEIFVDELPERASKMESYFQGADWEGLRQAAHQLKGAAGSYGFQPITDSAARLETSIVENDSRADIQAALEQLADLCRRARVRAANDNTK